jgi:hypothetical protein
MDLLDLQPAMLPEAARVLLMVNDVLDRMQASPDEKTRVVSHLLQRFAWYVLTIDEIINVDVGKTAAQRALAVKDTDFVAWQVPDDIPQYKQLLEFYNVPGGVSP